MVAICDSAVCTVFYSVSCISWNAYKVTLEPFKP
jgi:hypothetical protein